MCGVLCLLMRLGCIGSGWAMHHRSDAELRALAPKDDRAAGGGDDHHTGVCGEVRPSLYVIFGIARS